MEKEQPEKALKAFFEATSKFHKIAMPPHKDTHLAEIAASACMADEGNVYRLDSFLWSLVSREFATIYLTNNETGIEEMKLTGVEKQKKWWLFYLHRSLIVWATFISLNNDD